LPQVLNIQQFLTDSKGKGIIDVRSPGEFAQGHIPGAVSVPLFNNEERAIIGTIYKQRSRQEAVLKGLEIVGPKLNNLVLQAKEHARDNILYIHCWRGGMRSGFVSMLMEMYGIKTFTLKGGYKSYRTLALESFKQPRLIHLLGGKTGSGKTRILNHLATLNQSVIDLEGLAHHKGSAFGALGEPEQPTQEQFENELFIRLFFIPDTEILWLEDESRMIGKKVIPEGLWEQMRNTKIFYINLPFEERLDYITKEYGIFSAADLEQSILRITKRLGPEQTKNAIAALKENDPRTAFWYCLHYYDKTYQYGLSTREKSQVTELDFDKMDIEKISKELVKNIRVNG